MLRAAPGEHEAKDEIMPEGATMMRRLLRTMALLALVVLGAVALAPGALAHGARHHDAEQPSHARQHASMAQAAAVIAAVDGRAETHVFPHSSGLPGCPAGCCPASCAGGSCCAACVVAVMPPDMSLPRPASPIEAARAPRLASGIPASPADPPPRLVL
jgi:hypothetical protein